MAFQKTNFRRKLDRVRPQCVRLATLPHRIASIRLEMIELIENHYGHAMNFSVAVVI